MKRPRLIFSHGVTRPLSPTWRTRLHECPLLHIGHPTPAPSTSRRRLMSGRTASACSRSTPSNDDCPSAEALDFALREFPTDGVTSAPARSSRSVAGGGARPDRVRRHKDACRKTTAVNRNKSTGADGRDSGNHTVTRGTSTTSRTCTARGRTLRSYPEPCTFICVSQVALDMLTISQGGGDEEETNEAPPARRIDGAL
jgi:hypothetical protein